MLGEYYLDSLTTRSTLSSPAKYFSRVYNRADSASAKDKKKSTRKFRQKNGEMYQCVLRKLCEKVCLQTESLTEAQAKRPNIVQTRVVSKL